MVSSSGAHETASRNRDRLGPLHASPQNYQFGKADRVAPCNPVIPNPPGQRKSRSRASSATMSPDNRALTNGGCGEV